MELARLKDRNLFSEDEALSRIRSQMPIEDKKRKADYVIDNSGTLQSTEEQVHRLVTTVCKPLKSSWWVYGLLWGPCFTVYTGLEAFRRMWALLIKFQY